MNKRIYFNKKGKSDEEIKEHLKNQATKQKDRMRKYYKKNKIAKNTDLFNKFLKLYADINAADSIDQIEIMDIKNMIPTSSNTMLKCKCFDKLYECWSSIPEVVED